jgi:hypothetical protein
MVDWEGGGGGRTKKKLGKRQKEETGTAEMAERD